jgi:hypothetical protein
VKIALGTKESVLDPNIKQSWEEFLDPDVMRPRLIAASIYIAGFEVLKDSIVGRIRDFFWTGFDESGDKIDPKYTADVLARNRSPFYASLDWLREQNAIDDHDVETFDRMKRCRNNLAHKLLSVLGLEGLPAEFPQCFSDMVALLRKIEVWWITNVEIPTNPDFDGAEVDESGIVPGPVMTMQLLMDIALGDDERSRFYYDEFRKYTGRTV